jgi:hypothetical protein
MAVRHGRADDATTRPKHDPAERKADYAIESAKKSTRIRGSLPDVMMDSILPIPASCGRGRTTCVVEVSQGRCCGHEILLCAQPGRRSEAIELAQEGGHADAESGTDVARFESP